jgi:small subunit ribosomal protein S20
MANHTNAKKAHRRSIKRAAINRDRISRIRTFIKTAEEAISNKASNMAEIVSQTQKEISRGVNKNVIQKNTAARRISKLTKAMKAATETTAA